jgi:hypothetical protein
MKMEPTRALLAAAGALALTGCAFVLGPAPPADWPREVRDGFPRTAVAIDGGTFLGAWCANGVVVHSSREHGTYVLTNEHVAKAVADSGNAFIHVFDATTGGERVLPVTPFEPSARELLRPRTEVEELVQSLSLIGRDCALLAVDTRGEILPSAPLGATSPGSAPGPFAAFPVYPERTPHRIALSGAPVSAVVELSEPAREGMSGSAIFDAEGHVFGLIAWGRDNSGTAGGITPLDPIVRWLREKNLTWICEDPEISLGRVDRAIERGDPAELARVLASPKAFHHDLRTGAVLGLARLGALSFEKATALALGDPDTEVRTVALSAALAMDRDRADDLAAGLASGPKGQPAALAIAVAALRSETAIPERTAKALWTVAADERRDFQERTLVGATLVAKGAAKLDAFASELRDGILERLLGEDVDFRAERGTLQQVCDRIGTLLGGAPVELAPSLGPDQEVELAAMRASPGVRLRAAVLSVDRSLFLVGVTAREGRIRVAPSSGT